jgi:PQQ-dependent catabolism-associated CXXCW motif protein
MQGETLADQILHTEDGGAYRQFDEVGVGGFGTVFFGRDQATNRAVAIKRLHPHFASDPKAVHRFEREARLARSLTHPNVVRVLDQGRDGAGVPFLILEWIDGWTLAHQLAKKGRLPIGEAVEMTCQALAGLGAAHQGGIVHRDIKPANLMITPEGRLKVMDFGIARDEDSSTTGSIGTLPYMAPEQFGDQHLDGRTDLYALGATLYEALAGTRPFRGPTATAYLMQHLQEEPPPLEGLRPELPRALCAAVLRALAKEPADRFQTAADMRAALSPFAAAQLTTMVPAVVDATQLETVAPPPATPTPLAAAGAAPNVSAAPLAASPLPGAGGASPLPPAVPVVAAPPRGSAGIPPAVLWVGGSSAVLIVGAYALVQLSNLVGGGPPAAPTAAPTVIVVAAPPTSVIATLAPTSQPAPTPRVEPTQPPVPTRAPVLQPTLRPTPRPAATPTPPGIPVRNYANELTDWGVPPQKVLQSQVGSRTPMNIPGGRVVTTPELARAFNSGQEFLLVDALKDQHSLTIQGADRIPEAGFAGSYTDATQRGLSAQLQELTDDDLDFIVVFFCQGAECWESYNASLRAINLGYTSVFWYRGGLAAWQEAGLPLAP